MKSVARFAAVLSLLVFSAMLGYAQDPPDGSVGLTNGHRSTPITSTDQTFTFTSCTGGNAPAECALFGAGVQEIFAGINESGVAFSSLSIVLDFPTPINASLDPSINCFGGSIFSINNCPIALTNGATSVTVSFAQGTGSGIGCYDSTGAAYDTACLLNSIATQQSNLQNGTSNPYDNPVDGNCPPSQVPGEVCGSNDFVIGIGFGAGDQFTDIPTGGELIANPEPATIVLFGVALLTMLIFGLKKVQA
jgi:hypothetical protein